MAGRPNSVKTTYYRDAEGNMREEKQPSVSQKTASANGVHNPVPLVKAPSYRQMDEEGLWSAAPEDFDQEVANRVCRALYEGNTITTSCAMGPISPATYRQWGDEYPAFREAVNRSMEAATSYHVGVIRESRDWRASAWFLSRRYREDWGDNTGQDIDRSIAAIMERLDAGREKSPSR